MKCGGTTPDLKDISAMGFLFVFYSSTIRLSCCIAPTPALVRALFLPLASALLMQALWAAASNFPTGRPAMHPPSSSLHSHAPLQSISSHLWCVQSRWSPGLGHPSADASVQLCRGQGALWRCAWWVASQSELKKTGLETAMGAAMPILVVMLTVPNAFCQ